MRIVIIVFIAFILTSSLFIYMNNSLSSNHVEKKSIEAQVNSIQREAKPVPEILFQTEFVEWIGMSDKDLINQFGEPVRKDPSAYGYEWWVYPEGYSNYVQFGILNHQVITVYGIGDDISFDSIYIGQTYEELYESFRFKKEIVYDNGQSTYTFLLTEEDLRMRPLIKLEDGNFIQLYFDTITKELSSIRLLTGDTLLIHRDYETLYRGGLPDQLNFSNAEWEKIEKGMEKQIFDITNVIRVREGAKPVIWEDSVRLVAYDHSRDMAENNYFSHFALNGDGLKERLAEKEIVYSSAGENIAAQYADAPSVMEGWLNSKSHREALLSESYTHIGVGVYRLYYTQNFVAQDF